MERNARGFHYHTCVSDVMGAASGSRTSGMWKVAKRMIPYDYAVIGTTDRSEYAAGIYDSHGDGANDITLLYAMSKGWTGDRLAAIASRGDLVNVKRCLENARLVRSLPLSLD